MTSANTPMSDKELWQSLATDHAAAPGTVSELDFAAWLEGQLDETAAARVEAAVAGDPELRRAALDLADILGKPLPAAPPRMAVRAQALVGSTAGAGARGGWLSRLFDGFGAPRAAMATAAVLVAVSGFVLGGGLGDTYAQQKYVMASNGVQGSSESNELTAFFGGDGI